MIRPFTCLCLFAAFGSGLYLYSEKHRTAMLDRDISHVMNATEAAHQRTGMLRAEWALLNEPGRLQDMAERYLTLKTMAPTQFVQMADLSSRLPGPVLTPAGATTDDDDAVASNDIAAPPAEAIPPADVPAAKHPMIAAKDDVRLAPKLMAKADVHPRAPRHVVLADQTDPRPRDGMLMPSTPLPLAAPQPTGARVFSAMARPMHVAAARPMVVAAVPSYPQASVFPASSLGGRASLPPPTPYGAP